MTKLTAKKSLGQNFLRSDKAILDIVNTTQGLDPQKVCIVEIGGGEGVVTRKLLEKGFTVHVVELDLRAIEKMSLDLKEYIESKKIFLHHSDVLESDFVEISKKTHDSHAVVGNIPYYITGLIFRHIFNQTKLPVCATLMVQKEVADRSLARDRKHSLMSLSLQFYGDVHHISTVKAGSFVPPPKVDSAIIHINNISKKTGLLNLIKTKDFLEKEVAFFTLIKAAFKHPRKYALSNIKKYLQEENQNKTEQVQEQTHKINTDNNLHTIDFESLIEKSEAMIPEKERAEDVSLETWLNIIS